jgi:hypothetical protein
MKVQNVKYCESLWKTYGISQDIGGINGNMIDIKKILLIGRRINIGIIEIADL